jgi:hypothetical protein
MPNDSTTTLASELCALINGDGATPTAIRDMPGLMSLTYIRAEAPTLDAADAQEDAVAVTVRGFIEQASYALEEPVSERENKEADRGATARCLLGLYPGTGSMLLWERRKRAADHLVKHVRTMTKPRKVKGRMVSHETLLMEQLASQLWERETDFLREADDRDVASPVAPEDSPWLARVHIAWDTANDLRSTIGCYYSVFRPEDGYDFDYESLDLFGFLWTLVKIPSVDDIATAGIGKPEEGMTILFPDGPITIMFVYSPFERETIERLSAADPAPPEIAHSPMFSELITPWCAWLDSCQCKESTPDPQCAVHRFREALDSYIKHLERCWNELRDPLRAPSHYGKDHSPSTILDHCGLSPPPLDKYADYDV